MESKKRSRNNQRPSLQRGRGSTWNERKEEEKGGNKLPETKSDNTRDGLVGRGQGDFRMTERWKKVSKRRGREVEERRDTNKRVTRVARDAPSGYVKRLEGEGGTCGDDGRVAERGSWIRIQVGLPWSCLAASPRRRSVHVGAAGERIEGNLESSVAGMAHDWRGGGGKGAREVQGGRLSAAVGCRGAKTDRGVRSKESPLAEAA